MIIYSLVDPRNNKIYYVGKTNGDLIDRLAEHISDASSRTTSGTRTTLEKIKWIRDLLQLGLAPKIDVLEETDNPRRELYWIYKIQSQGHTIYNAYRGIPVDAVNDFELLTNYAISVKHNVDKKTVAIYREVLTGNKLGGIKIKPPGRPKPYKERN